MSLRTHPAEMWWGWARSVVFLNQGNVFLDNHAHGQEIDFHLKDSFLQEAPKHWEEYTQRAKALQGSFSYHMAATNGDVKVLNAYEMKTNGRGKLIKTSFNTKRGNKKSEKFEILGVNPKYAFALQGRTDAGPWVIAQVVDLTRESLPPKIEQVFEGFERDVGELVRIQSVSLMEMIRQPEFHVVRCRKVAQGGEELAEVVFDYPHKLVNNITSIHGGLCFLTRGISGVCVPIMLRRSFPADKERGNPRFWSGRKPTGICLYPNASSKKVTTLVKEQQGINRMCKRNTT